MLYAILYPTYRLYGILRVRYVHHYGIKESISKGIWSSDPFGTLFLDISGMTIILKSDYVFIPFWDPQYERMGIWS